MKSSKKDETNLMIAMIALQNSILPSMEEILSFYQSASEDIYPISDIKKMMI